MKALASFALLFSVVNFCVGRHAGHHGNLLKEMGFEKNFLSTNALVSGQHEKRIYYEGIAAKETFVSEEKANRDLALWQVTDGVHFIQSIYFGQELQDCEYVKDATAINKFLKEFQDDEQKLVFLQKSPEVNMNMSSVTRQELDNEQPPEDMQKMLHLHLLRKECDEKHELIKAERNIDEDFLQEEDFNSFTHKSSRSKRQTEEIFRIPGTQWCGRGYDAEEYEDMGAFTGTDRCCREHDLKCPFYIEAWDTKYGMTNWLFYTLNHCNCDERFYTCLKRTDTGASHLTGRIFFNIARTKCIVFKPERVCAQSSWWGKCQKWVYKKKAVLREPLTY